MQVCGIGLAQEAEKSVLALQPDCAAFFNNFAELQACMMELALKPADPPKLSIRTTGTTRMYLFIQVHRSFFNRAFDVLHAHPFVEAELQVREADGNRWATAGTSAVLNLLVSHLTDLDRRPLLKQRNSSTELPIDSVFAFGYLTMVHGPHSAMRWHSSHTNVCVRDWIT